MTTVLSLDTHHPRHPHYSMDRIYEQQEIAMSLYSCKVDGDEYQITKFTFQLLRAIPHSLPNSLGAI